MMMGFRGVCSRRYLPKLKGFPSRYIYEPWNAPESVQKAAKCIIGVDYPRPIVNHAETSRLNIERMKQIYQQLSRYRGLCKEPALAGWATGQGRAQTQTGNFRCPPTSRLSSCLPSAQGPSFWGAVASGWRQSLRVSCQSFITSLHPCLASTCPEALCSPVRMGFNSSSVSAPGLLASVPSCVEDLSNPMAEPSSSQAGSASSAGEQPLASGPRPTRAQQSLRIEHQYQTKSPPQWSCQSV